MLVEFSIYPMDSEHISGDVAKVVDILEKAGLEYRLGPMGTSIEGEWDQVMDAVKRCHQAVTEGGHTRVITHITVDDHRGEARSLNDAISRVEQHLGHAAKH